jgi:hypothetical protein
LQTWLHAVAMEFMLIWVHRIPVYCFYWWFKHRWTILVEPSWWPKHGLLNVWYVIKHREYSNEIHIQRLLLN